MREARSWSRPRQIRVLQILPLIFALIGGSADRVQGQAPTTPARDAPLRGGAFQMGPIVGYATFSEKARLDDCRWHGLRAGHRFDPFPGAERLQLEFRAGWEGCFTEHEEIGKVDLIHLHLTWLLGVTLSDHWRVYWGAGRRRAARRLDPRGRRPGASPLLDQPDAGRDVGTCETMDDRRVPCWHHLRELRLRHGPGLGNYASLLPSLYVAVQI